MNASLVAHDGFTDRELTSSLDYLIGEGFDVTVWSLNGGPIKGIQGWVHKTSLQMTPAAGADMIDRDLLVLVGGVKAMEYLRQYSFLIGWIQKRFERRKSIAAICHGTQLLIEADVIRGAVISGYYSIKKDIENAGAIYSREPVTVFDPFITSPHYDHTGPWIKRAIVECQRNWTRAETWPRSTAL